jgi:transcriptional regulator with XRE-family HTH domain
VAPTAASAGGTEAATRSGTEMAFKRLPSDGGDGDSSDLGLVAETGVEICGQLYGGTAHGMPAYHESAPDMPHMTYPRPMTPAELLRRARQERRLDQAQLARRAGTTQAYVSRVERGVVSPSMETLNRLLNAMGMRLRARLEPLPHGNASISDLRRDLTELTPEQRVRQAMELSSFLTGVAASAAEQRESDDPAR